MAGREGGDSGVCVCVCSGMSVALWVGLAQESGGWRGGMLGLLRNLEVDGREY